MKSSPQRDPSETAASGGLSDQHAIDFLGIGAQKAGTTWLWSALRKHSGIWMPPLKELHYWDRSAAYQSPSFLASNHLLQRLLGRESHNRQFRRQCWRQLRSALARRDWAVLRWQLRYYFGTYDDEWYLSLFSAGGNAIRGEITPAYSILDASDVARVRKLLPDLKVIYLLRNPVDRAWSQIRFEWTRGRFAKIDDLDGIKAFIEDPAQSLRGDYLRTLDLWGASFPKEQLYVGFYDDISTRPDELLREIFTFLGAAPDWPITPEEVRQKVLVSAEVSMPKEIGRYLARKYLAAVEELSARFAGPPEQWRREITAML